MLKNAIWLFLVTVLIFFLFLPSYTKMQDLKAKNAEYAREMKAQKKKTKHLENEIQLLTHDPVYLEKVAREKMGMIRKGEVVYKITPAGSQ